MDRFPFGHCSSRRLEAGCSVYRVDAGPAGRALRLVPAHRGSEASSVPPTLPWSATLWNAERERGADLITKEPRSHSPARTVQDHTETDAWQTTAGPGQRPGPPKPQAMTSSSRVQTPAGPSEIPSPVPRCGDSNF